MKLRHTTLIAAPVLGVISYITYLQLQTPADVDATQGRGVVSASPAPLAARVERGTEANVVDLTALMQEVASLRAEVLALRHQIPRQGASTPESADSQPAADPRSDPNARAEAARQHQAEMEAVDAAFRKQAIDPTWSANTASAVRETLSSEAVGGLQADNIDCRSQSCRVELHDDGSGRVAKSLPIFAQQMGSAMPTVTANTISQSDGSSTVVLYMSRDADDGQPSR